MVMLVFIYSTCLLLVERVEAADPDPLVDFSANAITPVFRNIFANGDVTTGSGGVRAALDIGKFRGLTYGFYQHIPFMLFFKVHGLCWMENLWFTKQNFALSVSGICRSEGLTVVQFKMIPCGENLPHTHPRATELLSLISGGPLQAGFVDIKGSDIFNRDHIIIVICLILGVTNRWRKWRFNS